MDKIILKGIRFHGYHGVVEAEREIGQKYEIDLELMTDLSTAGKMDDLTRTINYAQVVQLVIEIGTQQSFQLFEAIAEAIVEAILARFQVDEVGITVKKLSPPIEPRLTYAGAEIHRKSERQMVKSAPVFHSIISLCFVLITCQSVIGNNDPSAPPKSNPTRTSMFADLHPGIHIYRYDWNEEECVLYVAEMDRSHTDLHFEAAIANDQILGKETVRFIANRRSQRGDRRVLVAINGGFGVLGDMKGYGGALENLHIQVGELMTQPASDKEACFGVTPDGTFLIGPVEMEAAVTVGTYSFPLECINQRFLDGCRSILYTPRMGDSTHTNHRRAYEIILNELQLPIISKHESTFVIDQFGKGGNNPIPENGAVISFRSHIDKQLEAQLGAEKRGKIEIRLKPAIWNHTLQAIGGRIRLVKNGRVNESLEKHHYAQKKHTPGKRQRDLALSYEPRTALGYNEQKLILIVADGRRAGYSTGLSLYRLASLLVELGATEAINLDGGSSSTFVVDGKVVNRPSGQNERDVLNAILITADQPR